MKDNVNLAGTFMHSSMIPWAVVVDLIRRILYIFAWSHSSISIWLMYAAMKNGLHTWAIILGVRFIFHHNFGAVNYPVHSRADPDGSDFWSSCSLLTDWKSYKADGVLSGCHDQWSRHYSSGRCFISLSRKVRNIHHMWPPVTWTSGINWALLCRIL